MKRNMCLSSSVKVSVDFIIFTEGLQALLFSIQKQLYLLESENCFIKFRFAYLRRDAIQINLFRVPRLYIDLKIP